MSKDLVSELIECSTHSLEREVAHKVHLAYFGGAAPAMGREPRWDGSRDGMGAAMGWEPRWDGSRDGMGAAMGAAMTCGVRANTSGAVKSSALSN